MQNLRTKGIVMILVGASMWGASGTAVQYLFEYKQLTPGWTFMARNIIAGIIFLLYAHYKGGDLKSIWQNKRDVFSLLFFCLAGLFPAQFCYMKTIEYSNAATATVIQYLMPVLILLYSLWQTKSKPSKTDVIVVGMAMLGTYLLVTKGNGNNLAISREALVWGLASAFGAAAYTISPRRIIQKYSSPIVIGWSMLLNGLMANFFLQPWPFTGILDIGMILGMSVLILFGTILAFSFYLESTKYLPSTEIGALSSMEPLASVFLAIVLLQVKLSFAEIIGMLCIISTVIILARKK